MLCCAQCDTLARTPKAKRCADGCGYPWHGLPRANNGMNCTEGAPCFRPRGRLAHAPSASYPPSLAGSRRSQCTRLMHQTRHIELPGCFNLRDVGGYPTRSGATVAWRRLYRSAELSRIRPAVAARLVRELGIYRVIDLRTAEESAGLSCPLPGPCQAVNVPLLTSFRAHWIRPVDQRPEATASRYLEMVEQGLPSIARILRLLVTAPSRPTLIHCAVGRDRTGIVVALLLDLLEVEEEVIAADYALSDGVVDDGERAQAQTIHCLLALLRKQHISTRDMLIRAGVSAWCIDELQRLLLVRASRA